MGFQQTSVGIYLYRLHSNPIRGGSLKPREDSSAVHCLGRELDVRGIVVRLPTAVGNSSLTYGVKTGSDSPQAPNHQVQGGLSLRATAAKAVSY